MRCPTVHGSPALRFGRPTRLRRPTGLRHTEAGSTFTLNAPIKSGRGARHYYESIFPDHCCSRDRRGARLLPRASVAWLCARAISICDGWSRGRGRDYFCSMASAPQSVAPEPLATGAVPHAGLEPAWKMIITEIFRSIQGESTHAGLPCIFVRLTGCNLRCTWCDTANACHGGKKMSVEEVLARVDELAGRSEGNSAVEATVPLVELTGGEPLLQEEVYPLSEKLLDAGYTVMIETSGERSADRLPREVIKIMDVKCPDSGEPDTFDMRNLEALTQDDEVKFVLSTRRDYEFARDFMLQHGLARRVKQVLFSPVFEDPEGKWQGLEPRTLTEWILADGLPVRLGLQLHKFIWDPATKGV